MNKFIKEVLMKDLGWKVLSVMISVGLWFMVINIENPVVTANLTLPVTFQNESALMEKGLIFTNKEDLGNLRITLKLRGQRFSLDHITQSKGKIEATVDLSQIAESQNTAERVQLPIDLNLSAVAAESYELLGRDPKSVYISVDRAVKVQRDISIVRNGSTADGYVPEEFVLSPKTVFVSGAEKDVERVSDVKISVDLNQASQDINTTAVPVAFDADGNKVENVVLSVKEVSVYIPVAAAKEIYINATTEGWPREGYLLQTVTWEPDTIRVTGPDEALSGFSELTLPPIHIEGSTQNAKVFYNIESLLPDGVSLGDGMPTMVSAEAVIVPEVARTLHVSASQISMKGSVAENKNVTFSPESVDITVRGTQELVDGIKEEALTGYVEIAGLGDGAYDLQISFDLPEGVLIFGSRPTARVVITDDQAEAQPPDAKTEEEPTENPQEPEPAPEQPADGNTGAEGADDSGTGEAEGQP